LYYGSRPCHFAKNYDWNIGYGLILINKRGVAKKSASGQPENRASWMSRYDSLTFNQYGREFPSGGINEAGLAVELMWLDDAEYPADPRIPSFGTLEWIQYQLDQACHGQGCGGKRIPRLHRFGGEIALPGC
jgi:penicillin V acylase-like amidase (Ntn superfamily)